MAASTFVLQHGAWHGGWCWNKVARILRSRGHVVYTPTQTGLGERRHLLSPMITLDTFVTDLLNLIVFEDLQDVVLVGHSFAGTTISGVGERAPDRIQHLVYLDSLILEGGSTVLDTLPSAIVEDRRRSIERAGAVSLPCPPPAFFGVSEPGDAAWMSERLTPHPAGTYLSPMPLKGEVGAGLPRTYVACVEPVLASVAAVHEWVRAAAGWGYCEIPAPHNAMTTHPDTVADLVERLSFA